MRRFKTRRFAMVLAALLWITALSAAALRQAQGAPGISKGDKTTVKTFITEPPTLVSLTSQTT